MSEYTTDNIICAEPDDGSIVNLCEYILTEDLCNTYGSLSGGECSWTNETCNGTTSCDTYFNLYYACPPPCELGISATETGLGGRLRFRIFKDLPSQNSYGQYYHSNDYDIFSRQTGIYTQSPVDDLFSTVDVNQTIMSDDSVVSQLSWEDENELRIELRSAHWDTPSNEVAVNMLRGLMTKYHKKMWITISDEDEWDTITNYSTANAYFTGKPAHSERGLWEGDTQIYYDGWCEFGGYGPSTPFGSAWGSLQGWGSNTWLSNSEDDDNVWSKAGTEGWSSFNSEFGGTDNIVHINDDSISNLFPNLQTDWKSFLINPDAILIIGQYMYAKGATNILGENLFNNKHYGLTKIPASDFSNSQTTGVDFVADYQMTKMFQDGGSQYHACSMDNCCSTYTLTETDGNAIFCPYFMETGWFEDANEAPWQRIKFFAKDIENTDETFNYNYFYHLGGKQISDLIEDRYLIDANESAGGYNIKWPDSGAAPFGADAAGTQILPEQMFNDWRPIPHVFIGDTEKPDDGIYIQKYYDFTQDENILASAPNIVNLNMFMAKDTQLNLIDYISYYDEVYNKYEEIFSSSDVSYTSVFVDTSDGYIDDGSDGGTRTPVACCYGAGYCTSTCAGGVLIAHSCNCTTGAVACPPPVGVCYGTQQCTCDCTADCSEDTDPIGGCTSSTAINYDPLADYDDGSCYYSFSEIIDIEDLVESFFQFEIKEIYPDCSQDYECTSETPITVSFEVEDNKSDFYVEFIQRGYNEYLQEWPTGDSEWSIKIDIGNGWEELDELENLVSGTTYTFTIEPTSNDNWNGSFYDEIMKPSSTNPYYDTEKPGGINWRNHGSYANYYPRMKVTNQYSDSSNYVFKPEYENSGPNYTLWSNQVFLNSIVNQNTDWIIWHPGCTDAFGDQYNAYAYPDDDSCTFRDSGCTDPEAINYDINAIEDDNSCIYLGDYGFDENPVEENTLSDTVYNYLNNTNNSLDWMQRLQMFVVNWNFNPNTDIDLEDIIFPSDESELDFQQQLNNTFNVVDVYDITEKSKFNYLSHQYNNPGIKIIKAFVFSTMTNDLDEELPISIKGLTIKINLSLDNVYIEDFAETGGPDFKFLPFSESTPVISGISNESDYFNSLQKIIDGDQFVEEDQIDKINLEKAYQNREVGDYMGTSAIEQVRFFKDGTFDIPKLLGIEDAYDNFVNLKNDNDFYRYNKWWHWDGYYNKYPDETSVGSIFIDDAIHPANIVRECLMELNMGESDGRVVIDTSGNGNKGILVGDYKLSKPSMEIPIRRETEMKLPKIQNDDEKAL